MYEDRPGQHSSLVPKLCLGTLGAKLRFRFQRDTGWSRCKRKTEFWVLRSQTEFGNESADGTRFLIAPHLQEPQHLLRAPIWGNSPKNCLLMTAKSTGSVLQVKQRLQAAGFPGILHGQHISQQVRGLDIATIPTNIGT